MRERRNTPDMDEKTRVSAAKTAKHQNHDKFHTEMNAKLPAMRNNCIVGRKSFRRLHVRHAQFERKIADVRKRNQRLRPWRAPTLPACNTLAASAERRDRHLQVPRMHSMRQSVRANACITLPHMWRCVTGSGRQACGTPDDRHSM